MKTVILSLVLVLISSTASAGFVNKQKLKYVSSGIDGSVSFRTTSGIHNPAGCPAADVYVVSPEFNPKGALAVLLSAYTSGSIVRFYVDPNTCAPNNRPVVRAVAIGHPY